MYICSFIEDKATFFSNTIIVHLNDKNLNLDLNDYIIGVVSAEMPALFNDEALKAQSVASRSYATSKMTNNYIEISSSINDQVYLTNYELKEKWNDDYNKYYQKIAIAVSQTSNKVIKRDNNILKTYYFSMSNGYTENSQNVFKENTFTSVSSPYENENLNNFIVKNTFEESEIMDILNITNVNIMDIVYNDTHHVEKIVVNNKEYEGTEFIKR